MPPCDRCCVAPNLVARPDLQRLLSPHHPFIALQISRAPLTASPAAPCRASNDPLLPQEFGIPDDEELDTFYSCALRSTILVQGRLYLFRNTLAFYSNIFGFVTKQKMVSSTMRRPMLPTTARRCLSFPPPVDCAHGFLTCCAALLVACPQRYQDIEAVRKPSRTLVVGSIDVVCNGDRFRLPHATCSPEEF